MDCCTRSKPVAFAEGLPKGCGKDAYDLVGIGGGQVQKTAYVSWELLSPDRSLKSLKPLNYASLLDRTTWKISD